MVDGENIDNILIATCKIDLINAQHCFAFQPTALLVSEVELI